MILSSIIKKFSQRLMAPFSLHFFENHFLSNFGSMKQNSIY